MLLAPPAFAAKTLSFCYNKDGSYPWTDTDRPGLSLRIVTLAATRLGYTVALSPMSWQRCLAEVKANRFDGALAASYKAERLEYGQYPSDTHGRPDASQRMFSEQYVIVRPRGSRLAWSGKTVQPADAKLAAVFQVSLVGTFRALGIAVDDGTRSSEAALRKVLLGRADAAVLLLNGAQFELGRHPDLAAGLEIAPGVVENKNYFVLLGYAVEPVLARDIWNAIAHVRESPEYAAQQKAFFSGH